VAAIKGWKMHQMDVTNAFLHGDLFEEVYTVLPLWYTGVGNQVTTLASSTYHGGGSTTKVCRSLKSLCGLKQAPWKLVFLNLVFTSPRLILPYSLRSIIQAT